ncbi:MAG: DUF6364 family protein [Cytophagaceae bacterium]
MDVKLTLKLDEDVIQKAKLFAQEHNTSLSKLIENYLQKLTSDHDRDEIITPIVKELSGILDEASIQHFNSSNKTSTKK